MPITFTKTKSGVTVTNKQTGAKYHTGSMAKAQHLAHLHELFSKMKGT